MIITPVSVRSADADVNEQLQNRKPITSINTAVRSVEVSSVDITFEKFLTSRASSSIEIMLKKLFTKNIVAIWLLTLFIKLGHVTIKSVMAFDKWLSRNFHYNKRILFFLYKVKKFYHNY
ncbi:hypothetical protein TNIN_185671 [Trichonephila inaurata madagascariensis]|uniref:Uncharacterized protein n=1 Tax=Trichonephila inaurata madagascariensis TaxID=2747483 RepID=A0A8X7CGG0_9ARAC|nr:hypothetical protein TNIN_185671 [Trichonephila inaurata madagascariensis]